jgi:L-ribulose-5-phosphate 3-epimerase
MRDARNWTRRRSLAALSAGVAFWASEARSISNDAPWMAKRPRLAITTVSFRDRFPVRLPGAPPPPPGQSLLTAPAFVKEHLGLTNLEVWNLQFEDDSLTYCDRLRAAAQAVGGRIINVQLDGGHDFSSTDPEVQRKSVAFVKGWMERAKRLGAPSLRANFSGLNPANAFSLERVVAAFRDLAAHGRKVGVKVLCENHTGHSVAVDNVVAVLKAVNDPWCRTIADWGNSPAGDQDERIAQLSRLKPWLELVSAKGVHFDADYRHIDYDIGALTRATERTGFRGIYSVELFATTDPPNDPVAAARAMLTQISANLRH